MGRKYGQAFRLGPDVLAEGSDTGWVQILRTGQWYDRRYGWFEVDRETLEEIVRNFSHETERGEHFYADYDHGIAVANGDGNALAAGEIRELEVRAGEGQDERGKALFELWALVEWTERAAAAIRNREYRHTSAWFTTEYLNTAGEKLGPTLLGFAVTNRPVIHGMSPLALDRGAAALALSAEFVAFGERDALSPNGRKRTMAVQKKSSRVVPYMLGLLGLGTSATANEVAAKVRELSQAQGERDREKARADAAERVLAEARTAAGLAEGADLVGHIRTLSAQLREARDAGAKQAREALVEKALREGRLLPADKEKVLGDLAREMADGTELDKTPTAIWLSKRPADERVGRAYAAGAAPEQTQAGEADELEKLSAKHLREDSDLVALSKEGRKIEAQLLADERAAEELDRRTRHEAVAAE